MARGLVKRAFQALADPETGGLRSGPLDGLACARVTRQPGGPFDRHKAAKSYQPHLGAAFQGLGHRGHEGLQGVLGLSLGKSGFIGNRVY